MADEMPSCVKAAWMRARWSDWSNRPDMWIHTSMLSGMSALESFAELDHPGDALRERRIELGWTQVELANRSGVSQADISRIENGHLDARWSTIHRLSMALAEPARPRRSLANGARRNPPTKPKRPRTWSATGPTLEIS